jgi:hypothetical protein
MVVPETLDTKIKTMLERFQIRWVTISPPLLLVLVALHLQSVLVVRTRALCSTTHHSSVGAMVQVVNLAQTELLLLVQAQTKWVNHLPLLHLAALSISLPNQLRHKVLLQLQETRKQHCRGPHLRATVARKLLTM